MLTRTTRRWLARFMLACFALSVGVASASPLVHPRSMQWVCVGATVQLMVDSGDGMEAVDGQHTLDCALCLLAGSPPVDPAPHFAVVTHALMRAHWVRVDAPRMTGAWAPLPARGPPVLMA